MKTLMTGLLVLLSTSAQAYTNYSNCIGEAQIIAKIQSTQNCKAIVDIETVRHFRVNQICPLNLDEIVSQGIQDCTLRAGDEVSGVVIVNEDGKIIRD